MSMGVFLADPPPTGLSEAEAARRLRRDGPNELPSSKPRSVLVIAWDVVREPMFLLLLAAGAIYLLLGEPREAAMLLGFVFVVMGITLYQERKTERALEALRDLSSPRALVIRDGVQKRIAGREVVRGDILILSEGDRVPADAVLLQGCNCLVDESLLTGESVPVRKSAWDGEVEMGRPGGEDLPFVYSGTLVVRGRGIAEVRRTGMRTEIGKIGKALSVLEVGNTRLQEEVGRLVRSVAIIGLLLCLMVVVGFGLTRGNWLQGFLAGVALAMALLPEEFPVVLTIFLALGAWRMSRKNVLARRVPAIEMLGAATVLCVDKTGTLTMNHMSVRRLAVGEAVLSLAGTRDEKLPEKFHTLAEYGILASQRDPFDPMEQAFHELGNRALARTEHLHAHWTLVQEYPLSRRLLALSHVWKSSRDSSAYVIAAKGAPEAIADLCHLPVRETEELMRAVEAMARDGLRVLGVARSVFTRDALPKEQHDFSFEFLGLVGLADPVRPGVQEAVQECAAAGIRIIMITGDHAVTAQSIAREIGLHSHGEVVTGPELDAMSDAELKRRSRTANVFARVVPEQKLRLVQALKANGEVVAMTGDGVNDAPALKAAHIGIAMGKRGTDVAREASSLVLLDDHFSSIVQAVRMGRRIFGNLRKAMVYIVAIHVPIAGMSLLPVLFGWPLILTPVHILFLELIIDPACSTVFEAEREERDSMQRPPRDPQEPIFNRRALAVGVLQGLAILLIVLWIFLQALRRGLGETDARTLSFTTLILANLGLILSNRSLSRKLLSTLRSPNRPLWWVIGGALVFLGLVIYQPQLQGLFHFTALHSRDLLIAAAGGLMSLAVVEAMKLLQERGPRRM